LTDFSMPIILDKPDIPEKTGQIRVYPNPSEENINIEILNYDTNSKLALNDISGNIIPFKYKKSETNNGAIFTLSSKNMKPGIYFLSITGNETFTIEKLMIVK
ncbi:MAG: T9SS type A sorting domain-containing protein, partial [Bacteroidota bacterium]|nr:T9SS type A sorting domain-containing protein [Bacteroidota bacterium]